MRIRSFCTAAAAGVALLAAGSHAANASVIAYTGTGATPGSNTGNLNIGRQFSVTVTGITVQSLGAFDYGSDGLVNSHVVTLFQINSGAGAANASVTPLTSVTVPAGGNASTADNGFQFASLTSPVFLAPANYSVVVYGLNAAGGDTFGDGGGLPANGNVTDIRFDPYDFTANTSPAYPAGGDTGNHSSATFRYDLGNTTPEPACLTFLGLAAAGLLARRRRD